MPDLPFGKLLDADEYAARHDSNLGFEARIIRARHNCNLRLLAATPAGSVLEVGSGPDLLAARAVATGIDFRNWTIVEPARAYANAAATLAKSEPRLAVVEGYMEEKIDALQAIAPEGFDATLLSGVLQETLAPVPLLRAVLQVMRRGARVHVSVPNGLSFHRLLAVKMGLIAAPDMVTERNKMLGQPIVYTPSSLRTLLEHVGLVRLTLEGVFFKPFTNEQMARVAAIFGDDLIDGMEELGRDFPEHAAEICVTGHRA